MSFTASPIIGRVRPLLNDPNGNVWPDPSLLALLDSGIDLLRQQIPELRLDRDGLRESFTASSLPDNDTVIDLPDYYITPLEQFVIASAFSGDAGDERDMSRSVLAAQQFTALTGIPMALPSRR